MWKPVCSIFFVFLFSCSHQIPRIIILPSDREIYLLRKNYDLNALELCRDIGEIDKPKLECLREMPYDQSEMIVRSKVGDKERSDLLDWCRIIKTTKKGATSDNQ
jgi:hypothetical protein